MSPVHLVIQSIISVIVLGSALAFYRYIYPKKSINPLVLVILISILPTISIFRPGSYESGDLSLHTVRTVSFYKMLFVEHVIPRWTPEFNVGYGDPYFLFSYFLPYLIGAIFHEIGFSFLNSLKLLLAGSYILSGITMYRFLKEEFGERAGVIAAIFYLFTPYHLVDLHFRVTIAENLSFLFLPLILMYTKRNISIPNFKNIIFGSLSYSLLILSHQIIALSFIPISFLYGLVIWKSANLKTFRPFIPYLFMLLLGFALSAFYWIPILLEAKYTQASLTNTLAFFPTLPQLLYSPWRFGLLFQGPKGELSFIIGYIQLLVVVVSIIILFKKKLPYIAKSHLIFFLSLFFILFILMLSISEPLWHIIPFLSYFQYSYRLLEIVSLCIAVIAGIISIKFTKNIILITLCLITMLYTILNWGNRRNIPSISNDTYFINELAAHPDLGQNLEPSSPIWVDINKSQVRVWPSEHISIISGTGRVEELKRKALLHEYRINAENTLTLKENTLYFPGWHIRVDGKETLIEYQNKKFPGIILFSLSKGIHNVSIKFSDTKDRIMGKMISIISIVGITILVLLYHLSKKVRNYTNILLFSNNTDIPRIKRNRKTLKMKKRNS